MRLQRRCSIPLVLLSALAACVNLPSAATGPDYEYQVYGSLIDILGESRPDMVLVARTKPLECADGECRSVVHDSAPRELWADYVRKNQESEPIHRARLPRRSGVRLSTEIKDVPAVNCAIPAWIAFSRVGFNTDSTLAMVDYFEVSDVGPARGCAPQYGVLLTLERQPGGKWLIISPRPPT